MIAKKKKQQQPAFSRSFSSLTVQVLAELYEHIESASSQIQDDLTFSSREDTGEVPRKIVLNRQKRKWQKGKSQICDTEETTCLDSILVAKHNLLSKSLQDLHPGAHVSRGWFSKQYWLEVLRQPHVKQTLGRMGGKCCADRKPRPKGWSEKPWGSPVCKRGTESLSCQRRFGFDFSRSGFQASYLRAMLPTSVFDAVCFSCFFSRLCIRALYWLLDRWWHIL